MLFDLFVGCLDSLGTKLIFRAQSELNCVGLPVLCSVLFVHPTEGISG